jgi:hypothetical protein
MNRWGAPLALALVLAARVVLAQDAAPSPTPSPAPEPAWPQPPMVRLFLGGTTAWHASCARAGVSSCGAYDAKPPEEQLGDTVTFNTSVPYLGVGVEAEVLPLARGENRYLRGLGLALGFQRGTSETTVRLSTPSGSTPEREVVATDTAFSALALYRYHFGLVRRGTPLLGHVGLRAGLMGRAFDVRDDAQTALAGTHRLSPVVGLEVAVPVARWMRLEGAGHLLLSPPPGEWLGGEQDELDLEVRDFGESVSSFGWSAELGLAGDLWGPLGYAARFRLMHVSDTFSGEGARTGWDAGGVAEETYSTVHWGLTASW